MDVNAQRTFTKIETMNVILERKATKQLSDSIIDLSPSPKLGQTSLKNPQTKLNIHPGRLARIKMKVLPHKSQIIINIKYKFINSASLQ